MAASARAVQQAQASARAPAVQLQLQLAAAQQAAADPESDCPAELRASVAATGLLPVDYFRQRAPNGTSCDVAVRQAIDASHGACGGVIGVVYYPLAAAGFDDLAMMMMV